MASQHYRKFLARLDYSGTAFLCFLALMKAFILALFLVTAEPAEKHHLKTPFRFACISAP